jgi:CBS domain containing-hemolysin-like protein
MTTSLIDQAIALPGMLIALLGNACFVAAEYSLIRTRFSHFDNELKDAIAARPALQRMVDNADRSIQVIRLGLGVSFAVYVLCFLPMVFRWIAPWLPFSGIALQLTATLLALLLALLVYQTLGDALPRALGLVKPFQVLRFSAPVIGIFGWLTRPFRMVVEAVAATVWRLWARAPMPGIDTLDIEAQIELLRKEAPDMSTVGQLIFRNTLAMRDLVVADVLLPRNQVQYFDLNQSLEQNLDMARQTGHTRFPLCYGDLDRCIGLIHIKDIFRHRGDHKRLELRKLKRNIIRIDSETPLESALTLLLAHRMHMALVTDEFNGTEGVLTLERILEQLVGDIRDEFDADEEALVKSDDESDGVLVSGLTPLHEIEDIFPVELSNDEVSTIGGLVSSEFGRIPEVGDTLNHSGLEIEVTEVDETRVLQVHIRYLAENEAEEAQQPPREAD